MKLEALLLKAFFAASLFICAMTFGEMVSAHAPASSLIAAHVVATQATSKHA